MYPYSHGGSSSSRYDSFSPPTPAPRDKLSDSVKAMERQGYSDREIKRAMGKERDYDAGYERGREERGDVVVKITIKR